MKNGEGGVHIWIIFILKCSIARQNPRHPWDQGYSGKKLTLRFIVNEFVVRHHSPLCPPCVHVVSVPRFSLLFHFRVLYWMWIKEKWGRPGNKASLLLKVHPSIYATLHMVMLSKKHQRGQHCAWGATNKWRQTQFAVIVYASAWKRGTENHCMCTSIGLD